MTSRFDIREILMNKGSNDLRFEKNVRKVSAHTVNAENVTPATAEVSSRPGFVWVRTGGMNGGVHMAFNGGRVNGKLVDQPVILLHDPNVPYKWSVYEPDWDVLYAMTDWDGTPYGSGDHASTHEWPDYAPGSDPVSLYPRAMVPLRTYPSTGLTVIVWPFRYVYSGVKVNFNGIVLDLSAHQPASGYACRVLTYLDKTTNTAKSVVGTTITDSAAVDPPDPTIPDNCFLSALVRLDGDQASFSESDILDMRMTVMETQSQQNVVTLQQLALVESELDFAISTHVVG